MVQSLRGLASWGGEARLLDEQGRVLAGPFPDELMSAYPVERGGPAANRGGARRDPRQLETGREDAARRAQAAALPAAAQ